MDTKLDKEKLQKTTMSKIQMPHDERFIFVRTLSALNDTE